LLTVELAKSQTRQFCPSFLVSCREHGMKNTLYVIPCDVGRCHDFVCTGVLDVVAMSPAYVSARILEDVFQRVARRPNILIEGLSILPRAPLVCAIEVPLHYNTAVFLFIYPILRCGPHLGLSLWWVCLTALVLGFARANVCPLVLKSKHFEESTNALENRWIHRETPDSTLPSDTQCPIPVRDTKKYYICTN